MKYSTLFIFLGVASAATAQGTLPSSEHVFIITTDGFRWKEVFTGADSLLLDKKSQKFWDSTPEARRLKLLPFFWTVIAQQGQLFGNRNYGNNVDVSNIWHISYPGYNELLTGHPDPLPNPNLGIDNGNINVLEFLNGQAAYKGKVAAFGTWAKFRFILNTKRNNLPVHCGYADDAHTFAAAKAYVKAHHPSVMFLSFGGTDESAHAGHYGQYLEDAATVDHMIGQLWQMVQADPEYRGRTTFLITTDHGRGDEPDSWHIHGPFSRGSADTWLACIGAGIGHLGEMKDPGQIYNKQLAATIAQLLGVPFVTSHPVAQAIPLPSNALTGK